MMKGPAAQDIQSLFSSIAPGYDKANDWITFGLAKRWRHSLVEFSRVLPGDRVLDCATGTGDLAIEFKRAVGEKGDVVGTDFCQAMLERAPLKAQAGGMNIQFQWADVMSLPFESDLFDVSSIAYGIRNVENPVQALSEMARVTRSGGRVVILETGDSQWPLFQSVFDLYFKSVVPVIGGAITGKKEAYRYLNKSSKKFPSRDAFLKLMEETGAFSRMEFQPLLGGASFMYRGIVA